MILLDMDGVVANFVAASCAAHGRPEENINHWDYFTSWGITENQFWEPINAAGRDYWANLPVYPWFDELVALVKDADPKFTICTKPSKQADCLAGKLDWIHRYFGKHFRRYIFATDKSILAKPGRLLIDDSDLNCEQFSAAGGSAFLWPQPWNIHRSCPPDAIKWLARRLEHYKSMKAAA
jgi:5'(3')-deoxyribonucleotidase